MSAISIIVAVIIMVFKSLFNTLCASGIIHSCITTNRSMYHRAGLLSRSVHFFEGARAKFEDAYRSAPGCAEGLLLYSLVSLYLFLKGEGRGLCIIICFIRVYSHYYFLLLLVFARC